MNFVEKKDGLREEKLGRTYSRKYQVILVDPPWTISRFSRLSRTGWKASQSASMTIPELKKFPVRDLANEKGCHLFLWTTHKWLPYAFQIMKAWGFEYHCTLTWDKGSGSTVFSFALSTEFCLYGQLEGKWLAPKKPGIKPLIQEAPLDDRKKPASIYRLIEEFCGDVPRIELFAKEKREGWDSWGDDVGSDIELNIQAASGGV